MKVLSPLEIVDVLPTSGRVFIHGAAATPHRLLELLLANAARCHELELMHLHTMGVTDESSEPARDC